MSEQPDRQGEVLYEAQPGEQIEYAMSTFDLDCESALCVPRAARDVVVATSGSGQVKTPKRSENLARGAKVVVPHGESYTIIPDVGGKLDVTIFGISPTMERGNE